MPVPQLLLDTATPVSLPAAAADDTLGLDFVILTQDQDNWCWAAVAASVSQFYDVASHWSQCAVVNRVLNQPDCCSNGGSSACDRQAALDVALSVTGNLRSPQAPPASFDDIVSEIQNGAPVVCRIQFPGNLGHAVVIYGCSINNQTLQVADPQDTESTCDYESFRVAYKGNGIWTHTFFTT